MEEIINKIGEFSGAVGEFRSAVSKAMNEIAAKKEQLDLVKIEQDTRNKDLNAREAEIKKIEDVVALNERAKNTLADAEAKMMELKKAGVAFDDIVVKQKNELNEIIAKCKREQELIAQEHKVLDEREAKIKKDEEELVARLLEKIKKL